jgi:hypothetical protein
VKIIRHLDPQGRITHSELQSDGTALQLKGDLFSGFASTGKKAEVATKPADPLADELWNCFSPDYFPRLFAIAPDNFDRSGVRGNDWIFMDCTSLGHKARGRFRDYEDYAGHGLFFDLFQPGPLISPLGTFRIHKANPVDITRDVDNHRYLCRKGALPLVTCCFYENSDCEDRALDLILEMGSTPYDIQ